MTWEEVQALPSGAVKQTSSRRLTLEPGQKIRREIPHKGQAPRYNFVFQRDGRNDYHAAESVEDGKNYLYIWRDDVPNDDGAEPVVDDTTSGSTGDE